MAKQKPDAPKVPKKENNNQQDLLVQKTAKSQLPPGIVAQQKLQTYIKQSPLTQRAAQLQEQANQLAEQQIQRKTFQQKDPIQNKSHVALQRQHLVLQRIKDVEKEIYWEKDVAKLKGEIHKISGTKLAKIKDGSWAKTFTKMLATFTTGSEKLRVNQITDICKHQDITIDHLKLIAKDETLFSGVPKMTIHRLFDGIIADKQLITKLSPKQINHLEDEDFKILVETEDNPLGDVLKQYSKEKIEKTVATISGQGKKSKQGIKKKELNTIKKNLVGKIDALDEKTFEQIAGQLSGDQALALKNDQFKKLTETHILAFGEYFFEQLPNDKFELIKDKLKKATSKQISKIVAINNRAHPKNFQAFSVDFVAKIDLDTLENFVGSIQPAQINNEVALRLLTIKKGGGIKSLSGDALRKLFTFEDIPVSKTETKTVYDLLTDEHVDAVKTEALGKAPKPEKGDAPLERLLNSGKITKLDANGFAQLKDKHLKYITAANFSDLKAASLGKLPKDLFGKLDANLFKKLTTNQAKSVTADQFKQLSQDQIKAIPKEAFAQLPPATIAVLHMGQLKHVTAEQAKELKANQFKALSFVQVAELSDAAYDEVQTKHIDKDQKSGGLKYKKDKGKVKGQQASTDLTKHHYNLGKVYDSRIEALIEITAFASKMNEKLADSLLKVRAKYKEGKAIKNLDLIYQINKKWKGYVISVKDTIAAKKGKMIIGESVDKSKPEKSEYFAKYKGAEKFSNKHHQKLTSSYEPDLGDAA
ncbi:MAG: hypothetical protein AAF985_21720, partial [Bacteroidota bacterium]